MAELIDVDPRELRAPSSGFTGADPYKLQKQIARFAGSKDGMPLPWVYESKDGVLVIFNGITRAVRIAKLAPGELITVEVIGKINLNCAGLPRIGDFIS